MSGALTPKRNYSPEERAAIIDLVCEHIAKGIPLGQICDWPDMVSRQTFYDWLERDEQSSLRFARARLTGEEAILEQALVIAEDVEEDAQSRKVRIWARLEFLKIFNPKRWAEQKAGSVVNVGVSVNAVSEETRANYIAARKRANDFLKQQAGKITLSQ